MKIPRRGGDYCRFRANPANSLERTETVNANFPHLLQLARARDVEHYLALRRAGIEHPQLEVFKSSLGMGREALKAFGVGAYEVKEMSDYSAATTPRFSKSFPWMIA